MAGGGHLRGEGYDVSTHHTDISDQASVAALADAAAALGTVTRVVIAAGVSPVQASTERVLHVDLLGTAYVLEEFGRVIAPGGSGLVIASMAGHMGDGSRGRSSTRWPTPRRQTCSSSTSSPRRRSGTRVRRTRSRSGPTRCGCAPPDHLGPRRPRELHQPGIIATPLARDEMSGPNAAGYRHMIDTSAAGRMGTPSDVADAAALLLGPDGSFITGSDLLIDGGVIAAMRAAENAAAAEPSA